jgi:triphosphoribosyl-dephospho-CoA synthase
MSEPNYLLGVHAQLACVWEATARKPGNVHRYRDFADTSYLDYLTSAVAAAPVIALTPHYPIGAAVCEAVRLTQHFAPRNTNLGIALLLVPLARASRQGDFRAEVERVLAGLTVEDANYVYKAIRLANPGGLGRVTEQDVSDEPTVTLRQAMALSADRDLIARQYANGFAEVFDEVAPSVLTGVEATGCLEGGIIHAQLHLMARHPDSLIARKRGGAEAQASAERARAVLEAGWPKSEKGRKAIAELDEWLRAEGNARNPGTTADLIAAGLFVLLRTFRLKAGEVPWELKEGAA